MALTNINSYPVPHDKNGKGGGVTYIMKGGNGSSTFDTLNVNTINAVQGNITYLKTHSLTADDAEIIYLMSNEGRITKISGDELNYKEGYIGTLASDYISTGKLKADEIDALAAWIETLNSKEITTEYLTVTKQAHFFELIIDKLRSVAGQVILTAANCTVDFVKGYNHNGQIVCMSGPDVMLYLYETTSSTSALAGLVTANGEVKKLDNGEYRDATEQEINTFKSWFTYDSSNVKTIEYYDVYWRAIDEQGMAVDNGFIASDNGNVHCHDQAICQSFNVHEGTNYNVSNKYYWRIVSSVYDDVWLNLSGGAEQATATGTSMIDYSIELWHTDSLVYDEQQEQNVYIDNKIYWMGRSQQPHGLVTWTEGTEQGAALYGTMSTDTTAYGIEIIPYVEENSTKRPLTREELIAQPVTNRIYLTIKQLTGVQGGSKYADNGFNIGIYFADDTYVFYKDPAIDYTLQEPSYVLELPDATMPIEAIVIVSTTQNDWKQCHKMKLSNMTNECDSMLDALAGAPSKGDNIAQLGYRTNKTDDPDIARQSAIIISAYKSPDATLKAPSYAHYFGINDFDLVSHRHSYFDSEGARFEGDITLSNVDGKPITDRFMKLAVTSEPIVGTYAENGTRTLAPANASLQIVETESTTTTVPTGYNIFYKFTDKDGNSSATTNIGAGSSIASIPLVNTWTSNNTTYTADKMTVWLVKGNVYNDNILDTVSLEYNNVRYWKTDSWMIAPVKEVAYAGILDAYVTPSSTANTQTCALEMDLDYMIVHYKEGAVDNPAFNSPNGLHLEIQAYSQATNGTIAALGNALTIDYSTAKHAKYTNTNFLATLWPSTPTKQDYLNNYKNNRADNPLYFTVRLLNGATELDKRTLYISLQSGAILKVSDNAIISAVAASKQYTDDRESAITEAYTSLVQQTAYGIMQDVASTYVSNNTFNTEVEALNSSIEQQAGFIRSAVRRQYTNTNFYLDSTNAYGKLLDLTGLNADTYYRIRMTLDQSFTQKTSITTQIERTLRPSSDGWGTPSWGTDNEDHSLTGVDLMLNCTFITTGLGAISGGQLYVNDYWLMYANGNVIGDIGDPSSNTYLYLWLRGGSKYQLWCTNQAIANSTVVQNTSTKNSITEPTIYKPTYSEIEQTAERISLSVFEESESGLEEDLKRTGIDIENGLITLEADNTVIDGNLNIKNADEGLIIYEDSTPRISITNRSIGTSSNIAGDIGDVRGYDNYEINNTSTSTVTRTISIPLGTYNTGTSLTLANMRMTAVVYEYANGGYRAITSGISGVSWSCTGLTSGSGSSTALTSLNGSYTLGSTGAVSLNFSITLTLSGTAQAKAKKMTSINIYGKYSYLADRSIKIGTDGAMIQSSSNNYAWFGTDGIILKNGNSQMKLQNGTIVRNEAGTSNYGDISTTMPIKVVNDQNYSALTTDAFILVSTYISSGQNIRIITLPSPSSTPRGKVYWIKNISSDNFCYITTSGSNHMMSSDNATLQDSINIVHSSAMFMNDGWEYIHFNAN